VEVFVSFSVWFVVVEKFCALKEKKTFPTFWRYLLHKLAIKAVQL